MTEANPESMKRNYIRRKRYLNDSVQKIRSVLDYIEKIRKENKTPREIERLSMSYAKSIEAVCWSPHSRPSPNDYERSMIAKTHELCQALLKQNIPPEEYIRFADPLYRISRERQIPPRPLSVGSVVHPIIKNSEEVISRDDSHLQPSNLQASFTNTILSDLDLQNAESRDISSSGTLYGDSFYPHF